MPNRLLLVIPPVVRLVKGVPEVEADFANNLRMYLRNFGEVTFACPISAHSENSGILRSLPIKDVENSNRLSFIPLPFPYREDRYLLHYLATRKLLRAEISKADYLLFSPHAKYDWSTLAATLAIKMKRKYDMESDWVHESVQRLHLAAMPPGLNKIRKTLWMHSFLRTVNKCFAHSSVALLQGQDVFDAYKDIAPNPRKVLNVQVAADDQISQIELDRKLAHILAGNPLRISYAGRMIGMKGPLDWLKAVHAAIESGVALTADWFGAGSLMDEMRSEVHRLGIQKNVSLPGVVGRDEIIARLKSTDIFLFCHKTGESPRCLGEALATGCPLVGYGAAYPRELVEVGGGGEFAEIGDWKGLAQLMISLDRDRLRLARLAEGAANSGKLLDRDTAIERRIDLIKTYLS